MHGRALRPELIYYTLHNLIQIIDRTRQNPHRARFDQRSLETT